MLFKIRRNPPFFPRACHDDCNRRGGVVALVRAGNTSPTVEVDGGPGGSATGGTAANVLVVGPAPAHSCGPLFHLL